MATTIQEVPLWRKPAVAHLLHFSHDGRVRCVCGTGKILDTCVTIFGLLCLAASAGSRDIVATILSGFVLAGGLYLIYLGNTARTYWPELERQRRKGR